jgi:hypothetical protein
MALMRLSSSTSAFPGWTRKPVILSECRGLKGKQMKRKSGRLSCGDS